MSNILKGMEEWLVSSRNLEFYKNFDEVDEKWRTTIRPQMFPPSPTDRSKYNLNRWYVLLLPSLLSLISKLVKININHWIT